jgi:hypothetical protein
MVQRSGVWRACWSGVIGFNLLLCTARSATGQEPKLFLTFGIFIGSIEEGARIFTPTRLLPFAHEEALGHEFPTTLVHHVSEFETLLILGEHIGLKLWPTLQRYPREPIGEWRYPDFAPPPSDQIRTAQVIRVGPECSTIPGLRVVAYRDRQALSFIVDTRGLSLAERHMERATAMGLDMSRAQFLDGLGKVARAVPATGLWIAVIDRTVSGNCTAAGRELDHFQER